MIKGKARVTNPDQTKLELTVEMTVGEWRTIRAQLPAEWPSWDLAHLIRSALDATVDHVEQVASVEA